MYLKTKFILYFHIVYYFFTEGQTISYRLVATELNLSDLPTACQTYLAPSRWKL